MTEGDLQAAKTRIKSVWMAGDFSEVARLYEQDAADFVSRLGLKNGDKVLDACCGSGNLAILAARAGSDVIGVDIATNLLERARKRAADERLSARFEEGDVERMTYADGAFDVVMSMFGVMFAPRPEIAARELIRVSRRGGTIALASWKPDSFVAQLFRATARHVPPMPGAPSPLAWGEEGKVFNWLKSGVGSFKFTTRKLRFRFPGSPERAVNFWFEHYGPAQRALQSLSPTPDRQRTLRDDYLRLWKEHNDGSGDKTEVESQYLELIGTRRDE